MIELLNDTIEFGAEHVGNFVAAVLIVAGIIGGFYLWMRNDPTAVRDGSPDPDDVEDFKI